MVAFDEVLSGASARRRGPEAAPAPETERPAADVAPKPKAKVAKAKPREGAPEGEDAERPVGATGTAKGQPTSDAAGAEGAADSATDETAAVAEPQDGEANQRAGADGGGAVDGIATPETIPVGQPGIATPNVVPVDPDASTAADESSVTSDETPEHGTSQHSDHQRPAELNPSLLTATVKQPAQGQAAETGDAASALTTAVGGSAVEAMTGEMHSAGQAENVSSVATRAATPPVSADAIAAQTPTDADPRPASNGPGVVEQLTPDDAPVSAATASAPAGHAPVADVSANAASVVDPAAPRPQANGPQAVGAPVSAHAMAPEAQFAEDNHPGIVAGIRGQLMPTGGTMQIRLDPPELGPLSVTINIRDGAVEASFEASSDQAAKLLSHSLSALKSSLESQGVNVERLNVHQAPKSPESNSNGGNDPQQNQARDPQQEQAAQREQQRREMLRRMWRKLSGTEDPLDMLA